ncbi:MAG: GlsB/YeaQ/YmgE family stress response membrane protein [Acidobacteria bacterium]|nr:MAG: GlsB/YeaQ/YmgE family stress response membrane protein [Acidobacteriota bacterium]
MIGMSFSSFLSLLILGSIAAIVLHFVVLYKMLAGFDGFMNKWIAGWIGGRLGLPVLGHWGPSMSQVYIIPGLLGA